MRTSIILSAVVIAAGLVAAPLVVNRPSATVDLGDGGTDAGAGAQRAGSGPPGVRQIRHSRDGGPDVMIVGDRIGVLRNEPDGASSSTAAPPAAAANEASDLQQQIAALKVRTAQLEQQQAASQEQVRQLAQMNEQLKQLNAQAAARQAERAAGSDDAAAHQALVQRAVDGLATVLNRLAGGDDDVGDGLDLADENFPPQARRDIAAARDAIGSHNLGEARALVQSAISDAQAGR